jgi:hypothetical protein
MTHHLCFLLRRLFGAITLCKQRMGDVVGFLIVRYVHEVQTSSLIPEMKVCTSPNEFPIYGIFCFACML